MATTSIYALPYQTLTDPPDGAALGKNLAEKVELTLSDGTKPLTVATVTTTGAATVAGAATVTGALTVGGDAVTGGRGGINGLAVTAAPYDTTTSTTNVNLAGTGAVTSFNFTKRFASTRLRIQMCPSMYTAGSGGAMFGVRINGVDYDVVHVQTSTANERVSNTGVIYISGIPAGTWPIQGRWRRTNSTGTMVRDVFDSLCIDAQEGA